MSWRQTLQRLWRRDRAEAELDAELRDHVERQVADYVRAGMSARDARRRARLEFGGLDQVKELCRDARGTRWIEDISRDLRYACRRLARDRSLAALAITTLGLGIGLNVAVFAMVHAIFVRGLPYDDPGRIVNVWSNNDRSSRYQRVSLPDFEDYRRAATTLADLAAFTVDDRVSLSDAEHAPAPLNGSLVTANTFRLLGQPACWAAISCPRTAGAERSERSSSGTACGATGMPRTRTSSEGSCASTASRRRSSASCPKPSGFRSAPSFGGPCNRPRRSIAAMPAGWRRSAACARTWISRRRRPS